jgi:hypothetical protein
LPLYFAIVRTTGSLRIKTANFFPKTVRAIGAIFGIFGLAMVWTSTVLGLLFIFIALVIYTTHYGFEINTSPNFFREYVWVLGYKEGKKSPFKAIEFLFIQRGSFRFLTYSLKEKELPAYEGYLKFEGRNEVQMLTEVSKEMLITKLKNLAAPLDVEIKDYSEGNPVVIS